MNCVSSLWLWRRVSATQVSSDVYSTSQMQGGDMRSVCICTVTCASLSQTLTPPVHLHLHLTESSYGSVPHTVHVEGGGGVEERELGKDSASEENWKRTKSWDEHREQFTSSHHRMSHLARHCALNEVEWGGTPAEMGCSVCVRGWGEKKKKMSTSHSVNESGRRQEWQSETGGREQSVKKTQHGVTEGI